MAQSPMVIASGAEISSDHAPDVVHTDAPCLHEGCAYLHLQNGPLRWCICLRAKGMYEQICGTALGDSVTDVKTAACAVRSSLVRCLSP